jgi:hypothetical protein
MRSPLEVSPPRSSMAPSAKSSSRPLARLCGGGGERNSKRLTLSMPSALSCSVTPASEQRDISGAECGTSLP